jgi:ribosome-associated protein
MTEDNESQNNERPSKSERKRQMHALQSLGEELANLPNAELAALPVPDSLRDAIDTARRIKSREALRRQFQYIGKLMRSLDTSAMEAALEERRQRDQIMTRSFHELEAWRDRLIAEGMPAIDAVKAELHSADRQKLRQLVSLARKEAESGQPLKHSRQLFRYLRELKEQDLDSSW